MSKIVTWNVPTGSPSSNPSEANGLVYAENIVRYLKFKSPFSIKYCLEDGLRYKFDKRKIVVPPGSFFIANHDLEMECLPNKPCNKALLVFFSTELVSDVYRNQCTNEKTRMDNPSIPSAPIHFFEHIHRQPSALSTQLKSLAQKMAQSPAADNLPDDLMFSLAENMIAVQLDLSKSVVRINARTPSTREELFRRLLLAKEWMYEHWSDELCLAEIAKIATLSPYHFHRSFREAFGLPPMRWFRQLKLRKAKEELATRQKTVTEVAVNCGFADVFSFSKAFTREWGHRPSELLLGRTGPPFEAQ